MAFSLNKRAILRNRWDGGRRRSSHLAVESNQTEPPDYLTPPLQKVLGPLRQSDRSAGEEPRSGLTTSGRCGPSPSKSASLLALAAGNPPGGSWILSSCASRRAKSAIRPRLYRGRDTYHDLYTAKSALAAVFAQQRPWMPLSRIGATLSPEGAKRSGAGPKALDDVAPMWPPSKSASLFNRVALRLNHRVIARL